MDEFLRSFFSRSAQVLNLVFYTMQYLCKRVNDCFLAPTGALYAMMCYYIISQNQSPMMIMIVEMVIMFGNGDDD